MKNPLLYVLALLTVAGALAGCGSINAPQESALEWMARQPNNIDP